MSQTLTYTIGADKRALVSDVQDFHIDFTSDNSNWVQARQYEDSMRQVFVNVKNQDGTPYNLTGTNIWFEGVLPDKTHKILDSNHAVILDATNGQFRFDMPKQAFAVAGSYQQAFFRIVRDGASVTTLEFDLEVLADKVIGGLVPKDWIGPFEEIADQLVDDLHKHTDAADKIIADFQQKVTDLVNQLNQQGSTTTSMLVELQNRITDLETKIKQDGLFTQAEADAFKQEIANRIDSLKIKYAHVYPDVASMQADTDLSAGMYARTLGYYTQGDGGNVTYAISQLPNPYGISISNSLNAIPTIDSNTVNVLKFGVKNDGTQDCSEMVNKLSQDHALYFPAGKYLIADQLNVYHNIRGNGGSGYFSNDDIGLTTFVSAINYTSSEAKNNSTSVICNHGNSTVIQNINLKLNTDENGITDNGSGVTKIKDIFIYELKTGCGVKIDRPGSRASIIENLFIEAAHDSVYGSIGLYYLTGTDELLSNFWSMGCRTGIHAVCCLFYGTNLHIWCGSVATNIGIDWWSSTNNLYLQTSMAYLTNLYCDTAQYAINTDHKSIASVKNIIVNFDDSIANFSDKLSNVELSNGYEGDFVEFDGGSIYADKYSNVYLYNNYGKATVKNVLILVDNKLENEYLSDHYRYLLPNMAWGYDKDYKIDLPNESAGKYVEIARMPVLKDASGDVKAFISDGHNGVAEVLIQIADGSVKADNRGSGDQLVLAYRIVNNWLVLYAETADGYNTFSITADGNNTFSLVNYNYVRLVNQQEFQKLRQDNDAGLTKIPLNGSWVSAPSA